jgi:Xaa-Pro aminopeptidase/Xaa-Pro dipeptidase
MREAARLAGEACAAAWDLLRTAHQSGREISEFDLFRAMTVRAMEQGAMLPSFVNVRTGARQGMMHNKYPTERVIQPGDWVAMDYGFMYKNYNSDVIRVGCFGPPPPGWERYHEIQVELADKIRAAVRPGITVRELCDIKAAECEKHGLDMPWKGIGHCIGLNIHELPRINPDVELTLKPGVIFTCEPGFSAEGNTFCVEDVVLVTETGHETLSNFSRDLFIA